MALRRCLLGTILSCQCGLRSFLLRILRKVIADIRSI